MFVKKKDRFSIRKFKVGVGSVFLGSFLVAGPQVFAETSESNESVSKSILVNFESSSVEEATVFENRTVLEETSLSTAELREKEAGKVTNQEESVATEVTFPIDKLTLEIFKKLSAKEVANLTEEHFQRLNLSEEDIAALSPELAKALTTSSAYQNYIHSRGAIPEGIGFRTDANAVPADFTAVGNEGDLRKSTNNQFVVVGTNNPTGTTESHLDTARNQAGAYYGRFEASGVPANARVKFKLISATNGSTLIDGPDVTANSSGVATWSYANEDPSKPILAGYVSATYTVGNTQHEFRYKVDYPKPVLAANTADREPRKYLNGYDIKTLTNPDFTRNGGLLPGGVQVAHIARNAKIEYIVQTPDGREEVIAEGQNGKKPDGSPANQFPDNSNPKQGTNGINADAGPGNISYGWGPKLEFKKPLPLAGKLYFRVTMTQADGDVVVTGPKYDITTAPRIEAPASVNPFNAARDKTISGKGMPNQTIRIIIPGVDKPKYAIVDGNGNWSLKAEGTPSMFDANFAGGDSLTTGREEHEASRGKWVNRDVLTSSDIAAIRTAIENGEEIRIIQQPNMWATNDNLAGRFWSISYGDGADVRYRASSNDDGTGDDGRPSTGHIKLTVNEVPRVEPIREVEQSTELPTESNQLRDFFVNNPNDLPAGTTFAWVTKPETNTLGEKSGVVKVSYPNGTVENINVKVNVVDKIPPTTPSFVKRADGTVQVIPSDDTVKVEITIGDQTFIAKKSRTGWVQENGKRFLVDAPIAVFGDVIIAKSPDATEVKAKAYDIAGNVSTEGKTVSDDRVTKAIREIDEAATAKKNAIDLAKADGFTDSEIGAAKDKVEEEANKAKNKIAEQRIRKAPGGDYEKVGLAKQEGLDAIAAVQPLAKDKAKKEIDAAVVAKEKEINGISNASPEAKKEAIDKINTLAQEAKNAIDQATDKTGVDTSKEIGKVKINVVDAVRTSIPTEDPNLTETKKAAIGTIDYWRNTKNKEIDDDPTLTNEEKIREKEKVSKEADAAKERIHNATSTDAVGNIMNEALPGIQNYEVKSLNKQAAKDAIDKAATERKLALALKTDLTPKEREDVLREVDTVATAAKEKVDAATTDAEVATAKTDGVAAVQAVNKIGTAHTPTELDLEKEKAKKAIDAAAKAQKDAINNNKELSDKEKLDALKAIETAADEAKDNIDKATDQSGVDTAKEKGQTAIEAINPVAKDDAKKAIDAAAAAKKLAIAGDESLSAKEKEKANEAIDSAATEAKTNIDNAANKSDVDTAKDAGIKAINENNPVGKEKAKAEIEKAAADKIAAIEADKQATSEEQQAAKDKVNEEKAKALAAIDKANTADDVAAAATNGKAEIGKVAVSHTDAEGQAALAKAKDDAKKAIDAAAKAQKDAINNNKELSDKEKLDALKAIETAADEAKDNIDKATDQSGVDTAKEKGQTAIEAINPVAKDDAKKAIDAAAAAKKLAIAGDESLSAKEK
ncbi:DUF1542 domain-containing protein, partial [Carnobacteriaceae bacterium zg-ZUI78]|nr:DUF1542 domain-containing protein [Carnobacteriaceae bacterium zg-ZUI78]